MKRNLIFLFFLIIALFISILYSGQKLVFNNRAAGVGDIKVALNPTTVTKKTTDGSFLVNIKLTNNSSEARQIRVAGTDIDTSLNVGNFFTVTNLRCGASLPATAKTTIANSSIKLTCFMPGGQSPLTLQPNASINLGSFNLILKPNAPTGTATFSFSRTNIPEAATSADISDGGTSAVYNIVAGMSTPPATDIIDGPTPTPPPNAVSMNLNMKIKIQGIVSQPKVGLEKFKVKVTLNNFSKIADFTYLNNNIWGGSVSFVALASDNNVIYIKGAKHLQTKFNNALKAGENNLDFTNIYQMSGDLPNQDGVIDSYDLSLIRNSLGKSDLSVLRLADLNLDGIVDSQDFSLVVETLGVENEDAM